MRKFWGLYKNDKYIVGCNGATVYVYDTDWKELAKFNDFPYAYNGIGKVYLAELAILIGVFVISILPTAVCTWRLSRQDGIWE